MNKDHMGLTEIMSRPVTITLPNGRAVRAMPLDMEDHADMQAWIDGQQIDAFVAARKEIMKGQLTTDGKGGWARVPYSIEEQKFFYDRALALNSSRRVELGSPEANRMLDGVWGRRELVRLSIMKGTPLATQEDVNAIWKAINGDCNILDKIVAVADVARAEEDPKGDGGPTPETGAAGA